MTLQYLIFDASDDGEGLGSWEAVASVRADDMPQVQAEIDALVAAAEADSPGPRGPLDGHGVWDIDVQQHEDGGWQTLTVTLIGPWAWGESLLARLAD
ncbi:MAG: hypothetical protein WC999_13625 [Hydrogenophaga sp.]